MSDERRAVVYCGTRNIYRDMIPSLKSLLTWRAADKVYLLIEDDAFPCELPEAVETINVSGQQIFPADGPNYHCRWTWMVLMRAALTKILPNESRVLSLDCDTIIQSHLRGLWETDLQGKLIGMAQEIGRPGRPYYNAGVMLQDLDAIRRSRLDDMVIHVINHQELRFPEQDAINTVFFNHIHKIDSRWNASAWTEPTAIKKIVHYAANREWTQERLVQLWRETDWGARVSDETIREEETNG